MNCLCECLCHCMVCSVFYKADYCSAKELPNKEDGGISVVSGRKVTARWL